MAEKHRTMDVDARSGAGEIDREKSPVRFSKSRNEREHIASEVSDRGARAYEAYHDGESPWWELRRETLLTLAHELSPRYVYHAETIGRRVEALREAGITDRLFYALKANDQADVLQVLYDLGMGFECVSRRELEHLFHLFPGISSQRVLFTPNFAPRSEYVFALDRDVNLT